MKYNEYMSKEQHWNNLSPEEKRVIEDKGTEAPFSGELLNEQREGVFACRRCESPLYRSDDKFEAHCGWPSFDTAIDGNVKEITDQDGSRTEILCNSCGAHLGHVFKGEKFTDKDIRHCVNSISMRFVPNKEQK